jgi:hypothetical protein
MDVKDNDEKGAPASNEVLPARKRAIGFTSGRRPPSSHGEAPSKLQAPADSMMRWSHTNAAIVSTAKPYTDQSTILTTLDNIGYITVFLTFQQ